MHNHVETIPTDVLREDFTRAVRAAIVDQNNLLVDIQRRDFLDDARHGATLIEHWNDDSQRWMDCRRVIAFRFPVGRLLEPFDYPLDAGLDNRVRKRLRVLMRRSRQGGRGLCLQIAQDASSPVTEKIAERNLRTKYGEGFSDRSDVSKNPQESAETAQRPCRECRL